MSGLLAGAEVALRLGLVAVFLLAAAGKAVALREAGGMVQALLPWLPAGAARAVVVGTIGYELALAVLLAAADQDRAGVAAAAAGLAAAVFAAASVRAWRGTGITCRCFGSLGGATTLGRRTLVRAALIAGAVLLWYAAARAGVIGVTVAAARVPLCFAVAAVLATGLMWRRLLPGVAHRRFAAAALEAQSHRPLVVKSDVDGLEDGGERAARSPGFVPRSEREGVR
jgi:Methylamine utilisation protein MauE